MKMEETFGETIRSLREQKDITLRKFAQMVELSPTYISKIERGDMTPPGEASIRRIANILEIDGDELLALAGKVASDLKNIILEEPKVMPAFLRAATNAPPSEIEKFTNKFKNSPPER